MSESSQTHADFKSCCAEFYADEQVRLLLGDSFHPGGEDLTRRMLTRIELGPGDRLLDVASGPGTSALLAAEQFGCRVTALDLSAENLARTEDAANRRGLASLIEVVQADAERLPFDDGDFDALLCECAFCTFPDKDTAAAQMARVLKPSGRLALSDVVLDRQRFPADLGSLLTRVACIADAMPAADLEAGFSQAGFAELELNDVSETLVDMVVGIRKKLLGLELMQQLDKLDLVGLDLVEGKRVAGRVLEIIQQGIAGYVTLTGSRR